MELDHYDMRDWTRKVKPDHVKNWRVYYWTRDMNWSVKKVKDFLKLLNPYEADRFRKNFLQEET